MYELISNLAVWPLPVAVLLVLGVLFWSWRWLSFLSVFISAAGLLASGMPFVAAQLEQPLVDAAPPYDADAELAAGAIVVPTAGSFIDPDGALWPSAGGIRRAVMARNLQQATGLPVVLIGGAPLGEAEPEALVLARHVGFDEANLVVEVGPVNTAETARVGAEIAFEMEVQQVILVTSPVHVARMAASLRARGIDVLAAPVRVPPVSDAPDDRSPFAAYMPSADGFMASRAALREYAGIVYYLFTGEFETAHIMTGG